MEIKVPGWSYHNIRRFDNLEVDLRQGGNKLPHVALIMMRNGTGKTTTISLIRAILSGAALRWTPEQVREYQPKNSTVESGVFQLSIRFDSDPYIYFLMLDYENGRASYQTSRVNNASGGLEDGRNLPTSLQGIFDVEEFVNRFVFDGEQAKKTLNSTSTEAENAIKYLYRVDRIDSLIAKVRALIARKQEASRGASQQSVRNNKTRMDNKEHKLLELKRELSTTENRLRESYDRKEALDNRKMEILASNKSVRNQAEELRTKKAERRSALVGCFATIKARMREPFRVHSVFDEMLSTLANNMQTLKLPKTTAREFFKELSEKEFCICGRPIGPDEKQNILDNAEGYLGEDDLVAINAIKDRIRNRQSDDELNMAVSNMNSAKADLEVIESTLERLVLQLDDVASQEVEAIEAELKSLAIEISSLERTKELLSAPAGAVGANDQNNIYLANKAHEEAKANYNIALGTFEYTTKADKLISYLKSIRNATLGKLKKTVIQKTNEKVESIVTDERLIVERIDGNLVLQGRSGASEGQTLAIAYAYICSLFEHSTYEFPFIIDSPAASMDLDVRREVASVIPTLFKQLVIFVTSGEVAGFAEKMYPLNDVLYLTVEGDHDGDGAKCTTGKDYFATYQCEEEEE